MSKLSLERVTSSFGFQAAFNNILSKIESEFADKVLYRDNPIGEVNNMHNDLDMSGHDVLNVGMISADDFRVNGQDLGETVNSLVDKIDDALIEVRDAVDEAEDWANIAQQAATTVAYYNHEGVLLVGEDTITLPWSYDVNVGVEVYLSGVKQTESNLTFVSPNTVQIGLPVTVNTPFEVVASAGAKSDLSQPSGAGGVGYGAGTVKDRLDAIAASGGSALVGFVQDGTGASARTVQAKLRDVVSRADYDSDLNYDEARYALTGRADHVVRTSGASADRLLSEKLRDFVTPYDFGAAGDGATDDTAAIQTFLASGGHLHWGYGTYRITSQISVTASKHYLWSSSGARVVVDSSVPLESAIKIELAGFDAFLRGNIEIDCQDDAYAGLLVLNNASVFATCEIDGPIIRNVYRSGTTFNYGDGIFVFGAYRRVVIRNFEIHGVKMATGAGTPFVIGVTGVTVQRFNNSTRDAESVLIEDFYIDRVYSEDVTYGARDQDGIRVQQAYQKSEGATYPNPVSAIVQNGKIKNAHGRAVKMVSEFGIVKNILVVRNEEIYSGFKSGLSEDFDFQVSGGSISGVRCYYNNNCPESVSTFTIAFVDGRRSPTVVTVNDVIVSSFGIAPNRLVDVDVITTPIPTFVQINVSNTQVAGALLQLDEIVRLRNQNNIDTSLISYYLILTNVQARVTGRFVWRESATVANNTRVTAIQCIKSNPTNVPLVTGALTTNILSSLVGQNERLT